MAKTKKKVPSINGSSMADISFILLIFFLITTSMDTDKGIKRRLPPLVPKEEQRQDIEINDRNIMQLLVNRRDQIAILKKSKAGDRTIIVHIDELKNRVKEFIVNPRNKPELPEKEVRNIEGLGRIEVTTSSYAISLKNEVETSYQMYINVQNEILKAYNEVWDEFARAYFRTSYKELSVEKQKLVLEAYPMHVSEMPLSNLK
ncbi:ExbD/TolR family protein [Porphyromonas circumdentaria]|uniref:Biopolymer transport protein ExbD n=1 Tax=Porphyromonas circumdentaria TaxID=29524 RepID=A0A1T4M0G7_9PORP|nr:biopolymer transporter ExbD [Porphyromonas circumdentaria]MBB6275619.1 biopolymer transport protein ExbD [Porphyromonas circumdentaria]MDO4722729.1 biopolymer transporter ExbD [Porphyromonas circumdentaria]SJZ60500.1 Biopolymer transport protein ExbD [Porphyromonas circumdentaria]